MTLDYRFLKGASSRSVVIRIIDSTDGTPETAVEHNSAGMAMSYRREGAANVGVTMAALAALTTAYTSGGLEHIGNGYYRFDVPNLAFATGATGVTIHGTVTGMVVIGCYVHLVDVNDQDTVRMGMTALPAAAANAAGGLPISAAGALALDTKLANTNEITVARMGALTDWQDGGRLDNLLDAIPTTAMRGTDNALLASSDGSGLTEAGGTGDHLTGIASVGALGDGGASLNSIPAYHLFKGTADSGTVSTLVDSELNQADDRWWNDAVLVFTSGTLLGQTALITAFSQAADRITFAPEVTQAVAAGHTYTIVPAAQTVGLFSAYQGPRGPGVYLDGSGSLTTTRIGIDGTADNPVSSTTAAISLANTLKYKRIYWKGATDLTIGSPLVRFEIVGIGDPISNAINLNSQDADGSAFFNITVKGTQGGTPTEQIEATNCVLLNTQNLNGYFRGCSLDGDLSIMNNGEAWFHLCFSAVPGTGVPSLTFPATADASFRSYSGGLEVKTFTSGNLMDFNSVGGSLIVASGSTGGTIEARGNIDITDNSSGTTINQNPVVNMSKINAEIDAALDTAIPGSPTADSINERVRSMDLLTEASGGGDLADIKTKVGSTDTAVAALNDFDPAADEVAFANVTKINGVAAAAVRLALAANQMIPGTVDTVVNTHTPTTTEFQADDITEATTDHFKDRSILFTSGALANGQGTEITGYVNVGGIGQFTVAAMTEPPANNDTFIIV